MTKKIVIATIGTRDLIFQTNTGQWLNIGDDQTRDDVISPHVEVLGDLELSEEDYLGSYRKVTEYLSHHWDLYQDLIRPVIIGKLINEKHSEIEAVYLIGTDQEETIPERKKDTIHACHLISCWIKRHYPNIEVNIVPLGPTGTNPANFDEMFRWWQTQWQDLQPKHPAQPVWMCIKGGVGQAAEAGRISGLSRLGEQIEFFEFQVNRSANERGIASNYTGPFKGATYLWDRVQQQSLQLLHRYDYAGTFDLLKPYFDEDRSGFSACPALVEAGIAWNQGKFDTFSNKAKSCLNVNRTKYWWWMAYEQAYIAVVRFEQGNTSEAMLHSFRAIEGLLLAWIEKHFPDHLEKNGYPKLKISICNVHPEMHKFFYQDGHRVSSTKLLAHVQQQLIELAIPETVRDKDFRAFWSKETRDERNRLSHEIGGVSEKKLLKAWGSDIHSPELWQQRILRCLNLISQQTFKSLEKASLFVDLHHTVIELIENYRL